MIRVSQRPLTGPAQSSAYYYSGLGVCREVEIKLGRRPGEPGARRIQQAWNKEAGRYEARDMGPAEHRGQPAVTVDLNAGRSGARTFEDPEELAQLAREIEQAARWLADRQAEAMGEPLL